MSNTPENIKRNNRKWHCDNRHKVREMDRKYRRKLKDEMIDAYGGICMCQGCGEYRREFMSLDHMQPGEAKEHRKTFGNNKKVYIHLKKLGWPKDKYRLLCLNCNMSYGMWGYCPHQLEQVQSDTHYNKGA